MIIPNNKGTLLLDSELSCNVLTTTETVPEVPEARGITAIDASLAGNKRKMAELHLLGPI